MHLGSAIMGIFLANQDAPSRCTATDCLVKNKGETKHIITIWSKVLNYKIYVYSDIKINKKRRVLMIWPNIIHVQIDLTHHLHTHTKPNSTSSQQYDLENQL